MLRPRELKHRTGVAIPVNFSTRGAPRIVALGGGTGLPVLLAGLKDALGLGGIARPSAADRERLTAIVTVADDGGSSGRLRRAYAMLPPGDIRNCLLALSDRPDILAALFGHRFRGRGAMSGHNLGNLILAALTEMERGFAPALERAADMLRVHGRVLPATLEAVELVAEFDDGSRVAGESHIAERRGRIRRIHLEPEATESLPHALEAIRRADYVVIGPGSLYTSLIPVLLSPGLAGAVAASRAQVGVVMNLMSEPGETDGYTVQDHVAALRRHAPGLPIHDVIVNGTPIAAPVRMHYAEEGAYPVALASEAAGVAGCRVWIADVLASGSTVRHDAHKLAGVVLALAGRKDLVERPA
jgi:uncharacterized cofD-like protein